MSTQEILSSLVNYAANAPSAGALVGNVTGALNAPLPMVPFAALAGVGRSLVGPDLMARLPSWAQQLLSVGAPKKPEDEDQGLEAYPVERSSAAPASFMGIPSSN